MLGRFALPLMKFTERLIVDQFTDRARVVVDQFTDRARVVVDPFYEAPSILAGDGFWHF